MEPVLFFRSPWRLLSFVLFTTFCAGVDAQTTYYLSTSGNDANNGTGSGTAWMTIQRLNTALSTGTIISGDAVVFEGGATFRGGIVLDSDAGITFRSSDPNIPAVIKGSLLVDQGWTLQTSTAAGDLYRTQLPVGTTFVSHVYRDGDLQTLARFPNRANLDADPELETVWLRNDVGSATTIQDAALVQTAPNYWAGSRAVIRTTNWSYHTVPVSAFNPSTRTITFASTGYDLATYGWGYFLVNKLEELDQVEEWYYDQANRYLYYMVPTGYGVPDGIEATVNKHGMRITNSSNVNVQHLVFQHFEEAALRPREGSNSLTVEYCEFMDMTVGILDWYIPPVQGQHYVHNRFERCYRYGIASSAIASEIGWNVLEDIGNVPGNGGMLQPDLAGTIPGNEYGSYSALISGGSDTQVHDNRISHAGNNGIILNGDNVVAEKNHVSDALWSLNDGGAITFDNCNGLVLRNNIVSGAWGELESSAPDGPNYGSKGVGIYFGNASIRNTSCTENTVARCNTGILVDHNPVYLGNRIAGNTVIGCPNAQIALQDLGLHNGAYQSDYDDVFEDNVLYCLNSRQMALSIDQVNANSFNAVEPLVDFGSFSGNYYFNPFNEVVISQRVHYAVTDETELGGSKTMPLTILGWRALFNEDIDSYISPLKLKDHLVVSYGAAVTQLTTNMELPEPIGNWPVCPGGTRAFGTIGGSRAINITDCTRLERGCGSCALQGAAIVPGTYSYSFRMRSDHADALRHSALYNPITTKYAKLSYFGATTEMRPYELIMDIPSGATWDFQLLAFQDMQFAASVRNNTSMWLDDVVVRPCTLDPDHPEAIANEHRLYFNFPMAGTEDGAQNQPPYAQPDGSRVYAQNVADEGGIIQLPVGTCWADVKGNIYSGNVALDQWTSIVLYQLSSAMTSLPLTGGEYHITTGNNQVWNTNRNIAGSVVVDNGATLTIDGAIIGFAKSTPSLTTNVVVKPGGTLRVKNNGHLTSAINCDNPTMWNGIKVLGNNTDFGAGKAIFLNGGKVTNAHTAVRCAEGSPTDPLAGNTFTGGIVQGTNALFENNEYDIVTRPHASVYKGWGQNWFTNCTFRRTRSLYTPYVPGNVHVNLYSSSGTVFTGCTFENTSGLNPSNPAFWGMGIHSINTKIKVVGDAGINDRGIFNNLRTGILHAPFTAGVTAYVEDCDFNANAAGALLTGSTGNTLVKCNFTVPDVPLTELNVSGTYGAYLYGCSGFEFEENVFTGAPGVQHPKVGAVFRNTGSADNMFYNNRFDRFNDQGGQSVGTIIMGVNSHPVTAVGLRFKCNDYSNHSTNDFDIAFTGDTVSVHLRQGAIGSGTTDPAGNTFADVDPFTCDGNPAQHIFVQNTNNTFEYFHHDPPTSPARVVPDCVDPPINPTTWYTNAAWFYEKIESCPSEIGRVKLMSEREATAEEGRTAEEQRTEVYAAWKDDGDTESVMAYAANGGHSSSAVRDRLIQLAPKVGLEVWKEAFTRTPALNPWHLAQALLANCPLEPEVLRMMEEHGLAPFYRELVLDGQNGGVSLHSIHQSEIAAAHAQRSVALNDMVRKALLAEHAADLATAQEALAQHGDHAMQRQQLALGLADEDLVTSRTVVNTALENDLQELAYWQIQDLVLTHLETGVPFAEVDGAGQQLLHAVAAADGAGAAEAMAWLRLLGEEFTEVLILPSRAKSRSAEQDGYRQLNERPMLSAFPNPSNGPLYLTYQVPEGVERAEVHVHDAAGALLLARRIAPHGGILELSARNLAAGLHVATLYYDGIRVGTAKVNILH